MLFKTEDSLHQNSSQQEHLYYLLLQTLLHLFRATRLHLFRATMESDLSLNLDSSTAFLCYKSICAVSFTVNSVASLLHEENL